MNHSSLPSHGFFVKMLTRMKVELFHLHVDQIPIDFALEIQDIYIIGNRKRSKKSRDFYTSRVYGLLIYHKGTDVILYNKLRVYRICNT